MTTGSWLTLTTLIVLYYTACHLMVTTNSWQVAGGYADMAMGGDQGGSIRIPSAACGIVGLKPTYGLVPYTGMVPINLLLDHTGPMARTVSDVALLLEVKYLFLIYYFKTIQILLCSYAVCHAPCSYYSSICYLERSNYFGGLHKDITN